MSKMNVNRIPINGKYENFIEAFQPDCVDFCDQWINWFKNNPTRQVSGVTQGPTLIPVIDKKIKDSTDIAIDHNENFPVWNSYVEFLWKCVDCYVEQWPCSMKTDRWGLIEQTNVQYYPPGGGYKVWHTERNSSDLPMAIRHLVFMTYLNDVDDQGETEFFHQQFKIKPQKGLTLIWPADWTFTHRGIPSPSQEKYIITGWLDFFIK